MKSSFFHTFTFMTSNHKKSRIVASSILALAMVFSLSGVAQEEDNSFEGLYQKAGELIIGGQTAEAAATFEKLIDLSGKWETIVEDYGAAAGGLMFDYGSVLVQLQRWNDAAAAFEKCRGAKKLAEEISPLGNDNPRENLALFQLGFCTAQRGDHVKALELYDQYLATKPPASELAQILTKYKLFYGTSQMKSDQMAAGLATMQELFDNREKWKVSPGFLVQALLEIGGVWSANAAEAIADVPKRQQIENDAIAWLDANGDFLNVQPFDALQYGFVDRLKPLALQSANSGLYSLALRYLSYMPTTQQLKDDINIRTAMLGVKAMPGAYAQRLKLIEDREKAEIPPDVEVLRLMAICYEQVGNRMAPRTIHWHLATKYPKLPQAKRAEILHEAAKFSAEMGDFPAAQHFGELFMAEMPEDQPLRNRVATFMIQSLFTARDFEAVVKIAGDVRERYDAGDEKRELADMLYPLSLYSMQRFEEAAVPFDEFVKSYPESANLETVYYHRASNALVLQQFKVSAEQIEDFLEKFPDSKNYLENALSDLAVSRFNLLEYDAAISAADRLKEAKPESLQLARTLNVRGDSYMVKANDADEDVEEGEIAKWRAEALASYLGATDIGRKGEAQAGANKEMYRVGVAESMWKSADIYIQDEKFEDALAIYDRFFPNYTGNMWEAQISLFSIEALEAADRGPEALTQVEKMIVAEGIKPKDEQNLQFLREMIGSYGEASVRIRGDEPTIAVFNKFPGVSPDNQVLATWLKIQNVIILQGMKKKAERGSPAAEGIQSRIAAIFDELATYDKSNLSEYALQQIGLYLAGTENRFLAVPFFEELLNRTTTESEAFKSPADFEIGKIEMEDPAKRGSARERFLRVINKYKDKSLIPDSWMYLGRLYALDKDWKESAIALGKINENKKYFDKDLEKRAEATFLLGDALEKQGDEKQAATAYLVVLSRYGKWSDWVVQSFERFIPLSKKGIAELPMSDPPTPQELAEKRVRELNLYKNYFEKMYVWQKWTDDSFRTDEGRASLQRLRRELDALKIDFKITPEEDKKIKFDMGLPVEE